MSLIEALANKALNLKPLEIWNRRDPWPGIRDEFALLDRLDFSSASVEDLVECYEALLLALDADYFFYMPRSLAVVSRSPGSAGAKTIFELVIGPLEGGKNRKHLAKQLDKQQMTMIISSIRSLEKKVFGPMENSTSQELESLFKSNK